MIVYKMVNREEDGRLVSLMETGERQVEYKPGEASYPSIGVLYARNSREVALEAAQSYMSGHIPNVELWTAEASKVSPTPYSTIVGCKSLKLIEKIFPEDS